MPLSSQYLSPEPMVQSPDYLARMAQNGYSVSTYAYALDNPLGYLDRDGLQAAPVVELGIGEYRRQKYLAKFFIQQMRRRSFVATQMGSGR